MSIFEKFGLLLQGIGKKAEDNFSNKHSDNIMTGAIEKRKRQITDWEESLADLMASQKGIQRKKDEAQKEAGKYAKLMERAKSNEDLDSARTAFNAKKKAEDEVKKCASMITGNQSEIERTQNELDNAREEVDEVESNKQLYSTQMKTAKMRQALKTANSKDNPLSQIKTMQEQTMTEMDKADAREELENRKDPLGNLESKYGNADDEAEFETFMNANKKGKTKKA